MASSFLVLLVLSFLLPAAQSLVIHDYLEERGLPRGIFPDHYVTSIFNNVTGSLKITLREETCVLNFSSEVSQLMYASPLKANLTLGRLEFHSLVVMKLGPTAHDFHPVKKIVSPFHPFELVEFWSTENDLTATVLTSEFSKEKPCIAQSVENPGATINNDMLAKA